MMNEFLKKNQETVDLIQSFLKKYGPTRPVQMLKKLDVNYDRGSSLMRAMEKEGLVDRLPDGLHRGIPVFQWRLVNGFDVTTDAVEALFMKTGTEVSLGGGAVLRAMQAHTARMLRPSHATAA